MFLFCRIVIETLKDMESDRKCFRMVGGVLVEHTVDGVVPALTNHKEQVSFNIYIIIKNLFCYMYFKQVYYFSDTCI